MYLLLLKRFFKSKTTLFAFGLLFILGLISIAVGKQFLQSQHDNISKIVGMQEEHFANQLKHHPEDLGLMMYYVKFAIVNQVDNLAGIAIGQRDLNTNVQRVSMLNLESQKYDTDFINPMRQQVGNLDLSFVIVFLFPLLIISLTFNLYSEEVEKGTWKLIRIQADSIRMFLLSKLSIRLLGVLGILLSLFVVAKFVLDISVNLSFMSVVLLSVVYLVFWFAVAFWVVSFKKGSNINAIALLTIWILLVVLLPIGANKFVTNRYPITDSLSLTIKQRDGYHKKWDTDKKATMDAFYQHYPQFKSFGVVDRGFSWLWYYAMQQMGDDESKFERDAMMFNVLKRQQVSVAMANFIPSLQLQLGLNTIARTDLGNYISFLEATADFHEQIRLDFYPKIFSKHLPSLTYFEQYQPQFYKGTTDIGGVYKSLLITLFMVFVLFLSSFFRLV